MPSAVPEERRGYAGTVGTERLPSSPFAKIPDVPPQMYVRGPQYHEFDQWGMFAGKSPEYVRSIQEDMVAAGLIMKKEARTHWGIWTTQEASLMHDIMDEANGRGVDWQVVLRGYRRAEKKLLEEGPTGFTPQPYMAPDYASLVQATKGTFRQQLGRDPEPYEMQLLISNLQAGYREEYDQQTAADTAYARAQFKAERTGENTRVKGSFTDVDPNARMAEAFEKVYGPEVRRNASIEETQNNSGAMLSNILGLDAMMGGGGI